MSEPANHEAFLATARPAASDRRLAIVVASASAIGFVMGAPFASLALPRVEPFIPLYESALFVIDLVTAVLLLGQLHHRRSPAILVLGCGYLFAALMIVPHVLTFPGLFAPTGLLGAGSQSAAWLYIFWHGGFPLFVLAYAWLAGARRTDRLHGTTGVALVCGFAAVATLAMLLSLLAIEGEGLLPTIRREHEYVSAQRVVIAVTLSLGAVALVVLYRRRQRSVLDLWLAVVMCAWVFEVALSGLMNHARFDLGYYAGRIYGLLAASFVLIMLLVESIRLHARLDRSQERLRQAQKLEVIARLTGGVAHDFNNILTAILSNLEIMQGMAATTESQRRVIDAATRSVRHGARLTQQLLAFGRRQTLRPEAVDVNALLRDREDLLREAAGDAVTMVVRPDPGLVPCVADPAQFEAALLNLVINARDAMPRGGVLTIETRRVERRPREAAAEDWPPGVYVAVALRDTGTGMPPDLVDRVFEPFVTTKSVGEGSGLGLSQVYGFVKQMGGHITVDSSVGAGTEVVLYLPEAPAVAMAPPPRPTEAVVPARRTAGGEAILVVEDDDDVRAAVSSLLRSLDYGVVTARNGAEALAVLGGDQRIDLVLTDVVMPGMSGVEVANEAKRLRRGIKVLLTSGYARDVVAAQIADRDFRVVTKPYAQDYLATALGRLLRDETTDGGGVEAEPR